MLLALRETRPGNLDAEDLARRCKAGDWNAAPLSKEWEAAYALCARALQTDDRNVTALGRIELDPIRGTKGR